MPYLKMTYLKTARTLLFSVAACAALSACRSAYVETTLENQSSTPLHVIEIDYPSASFGTQSLAARAVYHYHFKIQGSGPLTLTFTDDAGKAHTATGPVLNEGQHGDLKIEIDATGKVNWIRNFSSSN
jgi:hypothetical protein